jgi:hypothetical protein
VIERVAEAGQRQQALFVPIHPKSLRPIETCVKGRPVGTPT